mgnify:CR=1 FL=1|tara:strand:+ start:126 stop:278 length:153 start_codon:yes stop_codon:yes gene_type:complete
MMLNFLFNIFNELTKKINNDFLEPLSYISFGLTLANQQNLFIYFFLKSFD